MTEPAFKHSTTYWQQVRIVARKLVQWPLGSDEVAMFIDGLKNVLYYGFAPFARILALLLLPISAPLFAWLMRLDERQRSAAKARMIAEIHQSRGSLRTPQPRPDEHSLIQEKR